MGRIIVFVSVWSLVSCGAGDSVLSGVETGPDAGRAGDAGTTPVDAGPSAVDAGPSAVDAEPSAVDAGPSTVDAGPTTVDAGAVNQPVDAGPPVSVCGPFDQEITGVSTQWGPAWARPDPAKIVAGWPLETRYELWWVPLPAAPTGTLAYRVRVPIDFDADLDPAPMRQLGYVNTAESPSTPVAVYEWSVSETACDFQHPLAIQSSTPPYGPSQFVAYSDWSNTPVQWFQVRPRTMSHCVPLPAGYNTVCLEPGHTYWWNLRVIPGGCDGQTPGDTSRCQPMIHVMRPRRVLEP